MPEIKRNQTNRYLKQQQQQKCLTAFLTEKFLLKIFRILEEINDFFVVFFF